MVWDEDIIFALKEEIGNPELFTGRKKEMEYFLQWIEGVKRELNQSLAFLARRKKGKTALVQRFFNILFTMNDPMIIPIYYKVKEKDMSQLSLADELYNNLLVQYAAFKARDVSLLKKSVSYEHLKECFTDDSDIVEDIEYMQMCLQENNGTRAWSHAANAAERISMLKDERIIQILDEFQYLDRYIYNGERFIRDYHLPLCGTYHHVGASKIAPIIVTGSYISWLLSIVNRMTGRYKAKFLEDLPLEEAMEAVYTYIDIYNCAIIEETAAYIATVTGGDVFYIASIIRSDYPEKDLTSMNCIDEIILHETQVTRKKQGVIAAMWLEYLHDATIQINDKNGKKIVLYLAKQGDQEKTRKEIKEDLNLEMTEGELEKKLDTFIQADILSYGQTRYRYQGLGDKFFEMVFRGMYQEEIDQLSIEKINADMREELCSIRGKANWYKGMMTEYAVINRILFAIIDGKSLKDLVNTYIEGYELPKALTSIAKYRIPLDQIRYFEVDIYLQSKTKEGHHFVLEAKNWETPIKPSVIEEFISKKEQMKNHLPANVGFIFYSEKPLTKEMESLLLENNIMTMDGQ